MRGESRMTLRSLNFGLPSFENNPVEVLAGREQLGLPILQER